MDTSKPYSEEKGPAEKRYYQLETNRRIYLDRARECSKLTIPSLVPPEGYGPSTKLETPYQSLGAEGVNNLSSKLLLTLLTPNSPFFRLKVDKFVAKEMSTDEEFKTKVEEALGEIERAVVSEIETTAIRVPVFEALKHLLVAGNVLLYIAPGGGVRAFHLDRFVVKRDPMGNVLEIVTKEDISPTVLPAEVYEQIKGEAGPETEEKTCALFTHVKRETDKWVAYQEVKGIEVPDSRGNYPLDKTPWIPLRFSRIDGEDYGRSYVEEYLGSLRSLEALQKAIVEGSAAAAKVLFLVNPNGTTSADTLAKSPNGAIREGNAQDVTVLQVEKFNDFKTAEVSIAKLEQQLARAFLMNMAVRRDAERVTAEEIRLMAGELEDALGGVYSILSQELQLPLVNRVMFQMQKQRRLPKLPAGVVRPMIVTGLEALGRGHDRNKLVTFLSTLQQTLGPELTAQYVNIDDAITRLATSEGIDTKGLIKTPEQRNAEAQQAQMQAAIQQFGPEAMKMVGDSLKAQQQGKPNG